MKKGFGLILMVAGMVLSLSFNANAAGSLKLGFFDANAAAMESQWGKRIVDNLKREQEKLGGELDAKGKAFKTAKDEWDKKKDLMDEKSKAKKQKELQDMATELEKLASESTQKFNQEAAAARKPLFDKMNEIANKIAKDDKYDFIFEKGALHFGHEKDDLTKRIASELDKAAPK